jgi:hypothetical protein
VIIAGKIILKPRNFFSKKFSNIGFGNVPGEIDVWDIHSKK